MAVWTARAFQSSDQGGGAVEIAVQGDEVPHDQAGHVSMLPMACLWLAPSPFPALAGWAPSVSREERAREF